MMDIGKIWNGWEVEKFIGEGAFGKVYKIKREDFGHTYEAALKVISIPQNQAEVQTIKSEGLSDESLKEYFESMVHDIVEEFALMSKLKGNSNIVSYEDHAVVEKKDEFGWDIYIRMELLTPLFDYLEEKTLTIRDIIKLGIDICKALEVCQKYNIIHRDIKPENVFVTDIGTYKLGDFGIARQLEKTSSGMSKKGTYTYMAPEVYKGQEYNSTVDIYSLGIVLYRFLNNNRTPFMPPAPAAIRYSDKENANILRLSGTDMPKPCNAEGRLAEIILKACAYEPKDRYESPLAMRQELQSVLYTEAETHLAYPKGDEVKNDPNDYAMGTDFLSVHQSQILEKEVMDIKESKDDTDSKESTMYMFGDWNLAKDKTEAKDIPDVDNNTQKTTDIQMELVEEKIEDDETLESSNNKVERKKKNIIIPIIIALVVLIGGIVLFMSIPSKTKVPNITNMTVAEAEKILKENGLELVEDSYKETNEMEPGIIISQREKAGDSVKDGSEIHVVVSTEAFVLVPDLAFKLKEEVESIVSESNLKVEFEYQASDTIPKDGVISQDIESGTKVETNSVIKVVISKGNDGAVVEVKVEDVVGMDKKSAKKLLESLGLTVEIKEEYNDSVKKGNVISQSIGKTETVAEGTKVVLVVSKGAETETENITEKVTQAPVQNETTTTNKTEKDPMDDWTVIEGEDDKAPNGWDEIN